MPAGCTCRARSWATRGESVLLDVALVVLYVPSCIRYPGKHRLWQHLVEALPWRMGSMMTAAAAAAARVAGSGSVGQGQQEACSCCKLAERALQLSRLFSSWHGGRSLWLSAIAAHSCPSRRPAPSVSCIHQSGGVSDGLSASRAAPSPAASPEPVPSSPQPQPHAASCGSGPLQMAALPQCCTSSSLGACWS
jgi:hypothetical protein